jgi:hypothetical protein
MSLLFYPEAGSVTFFLKIAAYMVSCYKCLRNDNFKPHSAAGVLTLCRAIQTGHAACIIYQKCTEWSKIQLPG